MLTFNAVAKGSLVDDKYAGIMDEKVVHRECFTKFDRYLFPIKQKKIETCMLKSIDFSKVDVIHSHTLFNGGWATYLVAKKKRIPYVVSIRNTDMNSFLRIPGYRTIARIIIQKASHVQFLSESYRQAFIQKCFPNEKAYIENKSTVIVNGLESFWLDNINYHTKEIENRKIELICVGKIDSNKNMKAVLESIRILNARNYHAHVTIIGQVVDPRVKSEILSHDNATLLPYMTKEELLIQYRKADIYVMPSFAESFGRVYAEAMTQGLPVIYTRGQGFDGQFPEGTIGYATRAKDYEELADRIETIYQNYSEISKKCISSCKVFDWKLIAESIDEMYQEAIRKARK